MNFRTELTKDSNVICGDDISEIKQGNNDFVFKDFTVKSFFIPSNSHKLYVFLSAIGKVRNRYPIFNRVSWGEKFDGNIIFFDDPTRNNINFAPSFYFGNNKTNVLDLIIRIVNYLKIAKGITNDDVTFISSSNGGFGVLYLCNELVGSKCIALCPQLDICSFFDDNKYKDFKDKVGISEEVDTDAYLEIYNRINLYRIAFNKDSKFVIYSNLACTQDYVQINNFCKYIKYDYHLGLNKVSDNFYLILVNADNIDPHLVQPGVDFCVYLDKYFWCDSEERKNDAVSSLLSSLLELNSLNFKSRIINRLFSVIGNSFDPVIKRSGNNIDIFLNEKIYIRVTNIDGEIRPNIRFLKGENTVDLDLLREFVKNSGLSIDESKCWVNIYDNPMPSFKFHGWINKIVDSLLR